MAIISRTPPADRRRPDSAAGGSCLIDEEAVVCDESGLAVFDLIRGYRHDAAAVLCAFDLLELDGEDLRRTPIEERKRILAKLLIMSHPPEGIAFSRKVVRSEMRTGMFSFP